MNAPVLIVLGTRPEAIKLWPVLEELRRIGVGCEVAATNQSRDLLPPILSELGIHADHSMYWPEGLVYGATGAMSWLADIIQRKRPRLVVVQGDTSTAFAGAFAAFMSEVSVAHVEAGLRTQDLRQPFPEEGLRQMIARIASLHFCPTEVADRNVRFECVHVGGVHLVGNTVVDALARIRRDLVTTDHGSILVTYHRRENWPEVRQLVRTMSRIALHRRVRWVLHGNIDLRQQIKAEVTDYRLRTQHRADQGIELIEPLGYKAFVAEMLGARCVVTDSGGVIEEATTLGKPLVIVRETTERPESYAKLIAPAEIDSKLEWAIENAHHEPRFYRNAFGDGKASERIAQIIQEHLR